MRTLKLLISATLLLMTSACGGDDSNAPQDSTTSPPAGSASHDPSDGSGATGDSDTPTGDTSDAPGSTATDETDGGTVGDSDTTGDTDGDPCRDVECSALDSDCATGICDPGSGECTTVAMNNDAACDTGDPCSTGVCIGGTCEPTPVDCSSLDSICAQGTCNPETGSCETAPTHEGEACDDGDLCTASTCTDGVCSGPAVDCTALDDECILGACDPDTGTCVAENTREDEACDDGDLCTLSVCTDGICAGPPVDCSEASDDCNEGQCNADTGACEPVPANEGEDCADSEFRCLTGTCLEGECDSMEPRDCTGIADDCNVGVCHNETGECEAAPFNDDGECNDGDPCTTGTTCSAGVCGGGQPSAC